MAIRYLSGINVDSNTLFVDAANNRVGIGTATPNTKLDVNAQASSGSTDLLTLSRNSGYGATVFAQAYGSTYFPNGKTLSLKNDAGIAFIHFAGNNAGTQTNVLIPNGDVGIGTASPGVKLDVNGEVAFSPNTAGKNTFIFTTNAANDARLLLKSDTTTTVDIQANGASYFNGGNVGIGTTAPGIKLDVNGPGRFVSDVASRVLYLKQDATNSGNIIQFQDQAGTNIWEVVGRNNQFYIYNANLSNFPLYIHPATSNVGIGTSVDSGYKLEVNGTGRFSNSVTATNLNLTDAGGGAINNVNGNLFIQTPVGAGWIFRNGAPGYAEYMRLGANGNLLIGTTTDAGYKLYVNGSTRVTGNIETLSNIKTQGYLLFDYDGDFTGGNYYTMEDHVDGYFRMGYAFNSNLVISTDGNIGIGTTSPTRKLSILETGTSFQLRIGYSNDYYYDFGRDPNDGYFDFYGNQTGYIGYRFGGADGTRLAITPSGNVGIGTTSPTDSNGFGKALDLSGTTGSSLYVRHSNSGTYGFLGQDSATTYLGTNTTPLSFYVSSSERMRITSGGNVLIGTTADNGNKLNVNGSIFSSGPVYMNSGYTNDSNYIEKTLGFSFANGEADKAVNISIGNISTWGYIEVEVTGTFSFQSTGGKLTKRFAIGTNPNNNIYINESRVSDSMGTIPENIAIGDFQWDAGSSSYVIPISHIVSSGNGYTAIVRAFSHSGGAWTIYNNLSVSAVYSLSALSYQYPYYNSRLGIGTTSPGTKLHIVGGNDNTLTIDNDGSTYTSAFWRNNNSNRAQIYFKNSAKEFGIGTLDASGYIAFSTAVASEKMRITNAGNVLIGTTTDAGYKLDTNGVIRATQFITVRGASNSDITAYNNPSATSVNLGTLLNEFAFIDLSSSNADGSWIDFSKADGGDYSGRIRYKNSTDEFQFFTAGNQRAVITSTGSVGIGTTSPSQKLEVNGSVLATSLIKSGGTSSQYLMADGSVSTTATINNYTQTFFVPNTGGTAQWAKLGTWIADQGGNVVTVQIDQHSGYNATTGQNQQVYIYMKTSNGSSVDANGFAGDSSFWTDGINEAIQSGDVIWEANAAGVGATAYTLYVNMGAYTNASQYTVTTRGGTWTNVGTLTAPSSTTPSSTILLSENRFVVNNILTVGGAPSGNVLIGTYTDAGYKLNVNGNTQSNGIILGTDQTYGGPYRSVSFGANQNGNNRIFATIDAADGMYFASATGTGFNFRPNGGTADLVKITSTGNVGIGADSPGSKLDVDRDGRTGSHATSQSLYVTGTMGGGTTGGQAGNIEFRHSNGSQGIGFGYQTIYQTGDNTNEVLNLLSKGTGAITLNAYAYSSGNVLIGTTTDNGYKLRVNGKGYFDSNVVISPVAESWAEGLSFVMPSTGTWGGLRWRRERSGSDGNWYVGYTALDNTDDLVFGANNGGSQIDNIMRMTKAGLVGIGTSSPSGAKLMVSTGDSYVLKLNNTEANYGGNQSKISFYGRWWSGDPNGESLHAIIAGEHASGDGYHRGNIKFYPVYDGSLVDAMTITYTGNVGIGTTSPGAKLTVSGNGEFTDTLVVSKGASDTIQQGSSLYLVGGSGASYTQLQQGVGRFIIFGFNGSSWVERFTINNTSGNVGIGTTAPSSKLHVVSASSGVSARTDLGGTIIAEGSTRAGLYILTAGTAAGSFGSIWWGNGNTNTDASITVGNDTRAMDFGTADGFRMRITNAGNVLIGTTTDSGYKLYVNGTGYFNGVLRASVSNTFPIRAINPTQDICRISFQDSSNSSNDAVWVGSNGFDLALGAGYEERMRINSSGFAGIATFPSTDWTLSLGELPGGLGSLDTTSSIRISYGALGVGVNPSSTIGRIDASNDIVAYSTSDQRLKENITTIANALDKVKSLTGVEFDWKEETKDVHGYEGHDVGVIAQEVQAVLPEAIRTNDTGYLSVRYEKMIALLIEGMKEQQNQIDELKAKIDGLTK